MPPLIYAALPVGLCVYSEEERWFRASERTEGDFRGWFYLPSNPAGVARNRLEVELDEEMGELVSR